MIRIVYFALGVICLTALGLQTVYADDVIQMEMRVTIIEAATSTLNTTLNFGTLIPDPGGDTFTIDVQSASTAANTGTTATTALMSTSGNTTVDTAGNSGLIDITTATSNVKVTITSPDATLTGQTNGGTVTVTDIAAYSTGAGSVTFTSAGSYEIHVGGALNIPATLDADTYVGNVDITLAYD